MGLFCVLKFEMETVHTGQYHAVVVTADPITGEKTGFRGDRRGPNWGDIMHGRALGRVIVEHHQWSQSPDYHTGLPSETIYNDNASCADINERLREVEAQINAARKQYMPMFVGWNSNSAARELLESAGLPVGKPEGYSVPLWYSGMLP